MNKKFTTILVLALCITLIFSLVTFAESDSSTDYKNYSIVADDDQIKILQDLYLKEISYGELVEKVYPEALDKIPGDVLKNMYQKKVQWKSENFRSMQITNSSVDIKNEDSISSLPSYIGVHHYSSIAKGNGYITYNSGSTVQIPSFYPIPYMSVITMLVQDDVGPIASGMDITNNHFQVFASKSYASPIKGKVYYTSGDHFGRYPDGYSPPSYSTNTSTSMIIY